MQIFSDTILKIDQTNKTTLKTEALLNYFKQEKRSEWVYCIALFTGRKPKGVVKSSQLKEWAAEVAEVPQWLFDETYHIVGDLAETIAKILPEKQDGGNSTSLEDLFRTLNDLKSLSDKEKKDFILNQWNSLDGHQRFVFNKMLTGGFRIGVSQKLLSRVLAEFLNKKESEIAFHLMGTWNPLETSFDTLFYPDDNKADDAHPYPFCLAHPLEVELVKLGNEKDWMAEYKWDGIRGQLVYRNNKLFLWSRGEELVTHQFPEFEALKSELDDGTVLDGEIVIKKDDEIQPFSQLQRRLGRKSPGKKTLEKYPAHFIAYDILEFNFKPLSEERFSQRREILETIDTFNSGLISTSELIAFNQWGQLEKARHTARSLGTEGLMLKRADSKYHSGRKTGVWWKWKVNPFTIDAVLVYAMRGHGRRANLYSDYTFAVWKDKELLTITKAYSGLTDKEMKEVDQFVKKNTIEKFGPVSMVKPEKVFEIAFDSLAESSRHKSGFAFRFPRIKRMRFDKPATEANSLEDVIQLHRMYLKQES